MDQGTPRTIPVTRTVFALAAMFALLHVAGTRDWLSELTRPLVVGILTGIGVAATDSAGELVVGRLHVPWTRDCAGLNILMTLWAIILWVNRAEPLSRRYWVRLALGFPMAFLANVARIFTLIGYRHAFFPAVESPQLHYFIGFLWVMPCLPFFVPRGARNTGHYLMETLFIVTALSLVSPFVSAPGGSLVTLSTLLLLAKGRFASTLPPERRFAAVVWIAAAAFIAVAKMESLWIPWLLLCPWFSPAGIGGNASAWGLVLGTIPMVSMHPLARWLVIACALLEVWKLLDARPIVEKSVPAGLPVNFVPEILKPVGLTAIFLIPFAASVIGGLLIPSLRPPAGVMARELGANTFQLHLVGQPHDVELDWFGPSGDGRHHTLSVCMRYRGIVLRSSGIDPSVLTDGKIWMREFFLQDGKLLTDYPTYLRRTFLPWTPAGVHIIASAPADHVSATLFAQSALQLATQVSQLNHSPSRQPKHAAF